VVSFAATRFAEPEVKLIDCEMLPSLKLAVAVVPAPAVTVSVYVPAFAVLALSARPTAVFELPTALVATVVTVPPDLETTAP